MAKVEVHALSYYPITEPDEKIIWTGKPNINALWRQRTVELVPILAAWLLATLIALIPIFGGLPLSVFIAEIGDDFFSTLAAVLSAVPVLCVVSVLLTKHRWNNIDYIVTNQRIIICFGIVRIIQLTVPLENVGKIVVFQRFGDVRNNTKTLVFHEKFSLDNGVLQSIYRRSAMPGSKASEPMLVRYDSYQRTSVPLFEHLENAQQVYDLIQDQINEIG